MTALPAQVSRSQIAPRDTRLVLGLALLVIVLCGVSLVVGRVPLAVLSTVQEVLAGERSTDALILSEIRMPRTILAALVGATLGLAGAAMQGLLRNPLAEPGILGVSASAGLGTVGIFLTAGLFGLTTFPIYSVAAAHAHDFASDDERVELSAALMFWFAAGAIFAPYIASVLIENFGPSALFMMISVGHGVLVVFGLVRMHRGRTGAKRTRYIYAPRTSFLIGRLTGRARDNQRRD